MASVSVIIPNYNHARYLRQRIDSVLAQTFTDIELILLDDLSTDNSREVLEQYRHHPKVSHLIYNERNSGSPFRQWQKGISLAKGEWIWIAESDDYCEPGFLQRLLEIAAPYDNIGISVANSHWVDDKGVEGNSLSMYPASFYRRGPEEVKVMALHCTVQNASSCIINRAHAIKAIEGLGKYKACGDWIFYTRLLQHADIVYTAEKLNYFRWYHANVSSKAKERLWVTEGIDLYSNIDLRIVSFTKSEYWYLMKYWRKKATLLNVRDQVVVGFKLSWAMMRFVLNVLFGTR